MYEKSDKKAIFWKTITTFFIVGVTLCIFFVRNALNDVQFAKKFVISILHGKFLRFLNPFNIMRLSKLLTMLGIAPVFVKRFFSSPYVRSILNKITIDCYAKAILLTNKLGKYKPLKQFQKITTYLHNKLKEEATKTTTMSEYKQKYLLSVLEKVDEALALQNNNNYSNNNNTQT